MNNSFQEIGNVILSCNNILLYPHLNMDGDAMGSSAALCRALRNAGKNCYILIEDKVADNLAFLDEGYCTADAGIIGEVELSICIDCGDDTRFPARAEAFHSSKLTVCIDHHRTTKDFCDYNYVDPGAAATGQLIYHLIKTMGLQIDQKIGEALFAAITTDTGNFQYSNTTEETHRIVAELYSYGIDANRVSIEIYENNRIQRLKITSRILATLQTVSDGRCAICYVTQDMLDETGALMEETEGVVQQLRGISGVEVAVFLKEKDKNTTKVSMRSKSCVDVAEIAASLGGGGHIRAAGATIEKPVLESLEIIKNKIIESLE
ncbi:MAG: bifunctional oligoribonuclease/PAP phosphatase NrnA [Firmicutes bacterium]|nr:bifunctional oligoribonuclease/PAP phosphatase NrnA [Bacillota bacterium]